MEVTDFQPSAPGIERFPSHKRFSSRLHRLGGLNSMNIISALLRTLLSGPIERQRQVKAEIDEKLRLTEIRDRSPLTLETTKEGVAQWLRAWQLDNCIETLCKYDGRMLLLTQEEDLRGRIGDASLLLSLIRCRRDYIKISGKCMVGDKQLDWPT
jgi:hypothetical protein